MDTALSNATRFLPEAIHRSRNRFTLSHAALAEALERLHNEDAVSLPLLSGSYARELSEASAALPYRAATPIIGKDEKKVHQDFELSVTFEDDSPFWLLTEALEAHIRDAFELLEQSPFSDGFCLNDLIVQRYEAGSRGITPHRDHIRYRELTALITLEGHARFFLCSDHSGGNTREIAMPPGGIVLLPGPDYGGRDVRPFHHLSNVSARRISVGLRYDVRAGTPINYGGVTYG